MRGSSVFLFSCNIVATDLTCPVRNRFVFDAEASAEAV